MVKIIGNFVQIFSPENGLFFKISPGIFVKSRFSSFKNGVFSQKIAVFPEIKSLSGTLPGNSCAFQNFQPQKWCFFSQKIPFSCTKVAFLVNLRHQYWFYYNKGVKCVCPFLTPLGIMGQPPVSIILIFIISLYFRCFRAISIFRQFSTIFI